MTIFWILAGVTVWFSITSVTMAGESAHLRQFGYNYEASLFADEAWGRIVMAVIAYVVTIVYAAYLVATLLV